MAKVIVFGPTGNIASVAAITAQQNGAKVTLAMRDPQKTIPGLSQQAERDGGFQRVQADLTKPDTITAAIKSSGATRAFFYLAFGMPDHMKSSISALKSAGVEFVVFLSSSTIQVDKKDVSPKEIIPYMHAQVELSLDAVYGEDNYVAVRPGRFATNLLRQKAAVQEGEVRLFGGHFVQDCITPDDMGKVSGYVLAKGPKEGQKKVYLYGPQLLTQRDAFKIVGKALGRDVKTVEIDENEGREQFLKQGIPPPLIDYFISHLTKPEEKELGPDSKFYSEGLKNVELYTGKPATGLQEWVSANKELFV